MTINDLVRDEKLEYDINSSQNIRSSGKICKYEYLTGK